MGIDKNKVLAVLKKYGIVIVLVLVCIFLSIVRPQFRNINNIMNVLNQAAIYGILALGMTLCIVAKGSDLSVGSILALAGVISGSFAQRLTDDGGRELAGKIFAGMGPAPIAVAVLVALLVGTACGAFNGYIISKFSMHPFIATLGMQTIARGLALLYTGGKPVSNLVPAYDFFGGKLFGSIPMPVVVYALAITAMWILLNHTSFGKSVYAIGANSNAAEISGVKVKRNVMLIFTIMGFCAGLAAVVFIGRTGSAHPGAATGYELTAIAATTIGGTSQTGGIGTVWGAVVGAVLLSVVKNGMTLLGIHAYWQQVVEGAIIIAAVIFDMRKNAKKK